MISKNAFHVAQIHTLAAICNRLSTLSFSRSYDEFREETRGMCNFYGAGYLVDGQSSQGYANLQGCEGSELLTDIAHGINRFINGPFKFGVKRKQDLGYVFRGYAEKLRAIARGAIVELNMLESGLYFELVNVSGSSDARIKITKNNGESYAVSGMTYVYRDIKAGLDAARIEEARQNRDFEAVITEESLKEITHKNVPFAFPMANGELLGVGVNRGGANGKYLVLCKHLGREGSHLATRRAELKKDCFFANSVGEICEKVRDFAGLKLWGIKPMLFDVNKLTKLLNIEEIKQYTQNNQRFFITLDSKFYGQWMSVLTDDVQSGINARVMWSILTKDGPNPTHQHKNVMVSGGNYHELVKAIIDLVNGWNAEEIEAEKALKAG